MPKLLIISLNGDPLNKYGTQHAGGQIKYILELGKYLVRDGWNIDVITVKNSGLSNHSVITEGFEVFRFSLPKSEDYSYSINENDLVYLSNSICEFVKDRGYSLIYSCYWLSGIIGLDVRGLIDKKLLISFCSLGYLKRASSGESSTLSFRIESELRVAKNCDHIIATTLEEEKLLIEEYLAPKKKITIIPRGVDLKAFYKYESL